jgi:hypothetical protein
MQKNNFDSEIKKSIIEYKKNNKNFFKIEGIIHIIFHFICNRFIEFVNVVDKTKTSDDDVWDKLPELQNAIKTYKSINSLLNDWEEKNFENNLNVELTYESYSKFAKYQATQKILDIEKEELDKQQQTILNELINKIKFIEIPESLRQYILTDEEKPPAEDNSAQVKEKQPQVEENLAQELVKYDIATDNVPNVGYTVVGDNEDNEDNEEEGS